MEDTLKILTALMASPSAILNHIHCCEYGLPKSFASTLKSLVTVNIKEVIDCTRYRKDSVELLHSILSAITNGAESNLRTVSLTDLSKTLEENSKKKRTYAIVLERVEELGHLNKEFLRGFFDSFKQCSWVTLITISELPWSKIESSYFRSNISSPLEFFYPAHSTDASIQAVCEQTKFSKTFVKYVADTVDLHYANRPELLLHIVKFVAAEYQAENAHALNFTSDFSANAAKKLGPICKQLKSDSAFVAKGLLSADVNGLNMTRLDHPLLARYAIVATYCASYNPQSTDKRFFFSGRDILRRKHKAILKSHEKFHETGPRPFDQQRALFIFLYFWNQFADEKAEIQRDGIQIDFNSQLVYLVRAGLLGMVSSPENLDLPKYRALCSLEYAQRIATSINSELQIKEYLNDLALE